MEEALSPDHLSSLDVEIDPDFEPQKRPRSCTWPLPRPESNVGKPGSTDNEIIPKEGDDDASTSVTSGTNGIVGYTSTTGGDGNSPNATPVEGINAVSTTLLKSGSSLSPATPGAGQESHQPKKSSSRRNAWGNLSYADLITKAIESSPEKRLTLSQIYDWMVRCVGLPYFNDKGDSNSSAGWKSLLSSLKVFWPFVLTKPVTTEQRKSFSLILSFGNCCLNKMCAFTTVTSTKCQRSLCHHFQLFRSIAYRDFRMWTQPIYLLYSTTAFGHGI
ncbi:hypothetical protein SKAU_G00208440 [Synaphobranchus kaupii]|uniref:Fork-head domain-containing protein n=1 Tax=Synaphobranchus kaupii TaxID=118154 RepID=A0A9Q1F8L1_SYNKA|nr:hypothetical protein SKAU_G00208440 [Synaphobranchus kaupii]